MRILYALALACAVSAPAPRAQAICSNGTNGVRLSISRAENTGDALRVCFALQGNPAESLGTLQYRLSYNLGALRVQNARGIPTGSPYDSGTYNTNVTHCLSSPVCDDNFYPMVSASGGPYLPFSAEPVEFICHTFAIVDPSRTAGLRVDGLIAQQGDGAQATTCPAGDLPGYNAPLPAEEGLGAGTTVTVGPNPTRGRAVIEVALPSPGRVRVTLHDALGREVAVVAAGAWGPGTHVVPVADGSLPAGVYTVRLAVDGRVAGSTPFTVAR